MPTNVSSLLTDLSAADATKRAAAAEELAELGPDAQAAAVALVRANGDADDTVRRWSTSALEDLGPPSPDQIRELISLTDSQTSDVVYWAVTLLGRAGADASAAVTPLAVVLKKSPDLAVRERAAWALGAIGPAAKGALPALHEAAATKEPRIARLASKAIELIGE